MKMRGVLATIAVAMTMSVLTCGTAMAFTPHSADAAFVQTKDENEDNERAGGAPRGAGCTNGYQGNCSQEQKDAYDEASRQSLDRNKKKD